MFKYDEEGMVNGTILVHTVYDLLYLSKDTNFWTTLNQNITKFQPNGFKYEWQDFYRLRDDLGSLGDAEEESSRAGGF